MKQRHPKHAKRNTDKLQFTSVFGTMDYRPLTISFNGKLDLADDVEKHMPEAAVHRNGKIEDWNYRVMIPAMFAMIKSQKSEIDLLKQELNEIKQLLRKE